MKKFLAIVLAMLAITALADQRDFVIKDCAATVTNTASVKIDDRFLYSVIVVGGSAWTGNVSVATAYETLLTRSSITGNDVSRPRYPAENDVGGTLGNTNAYELMYFESDTVTVTVESSSVTTNDVQIKLKMLE